jgi:elongation factor G
MFNLKSCRYLIRNININKSIIRNKNRPFQLNVKSNISSIRNVGIVAHIDAGKTTTSEQMLYLCGEINSVGRVDSGDTVLDFMTQERERGITIQSAAISAKWKNYNINLIDTPGHVDFTIEVERASRVLDGVVVIVDAVSGVQSQTQTVWKQTRKQSIPAIAFINKMDRIGADFDRSLKSLKKKLSMNVVPIQLPIGNEDTFSGVIDLLTLNKVIWGIGSENMKNKTRPSEPVITPLEIDDPLYNEALGLRRNMIESLSEFDDEMMDQYLEDTSDKLDSFDIKYLVASIRKNCVIGNIVPAMSGASLRGKGVEPLLDALISFLPSPLDRPPSVAINTLDKSKIKSLTPSSKELCALAFKVVYDASRGPLVYVRTYSGSLEVKQVLHNSTRNTKERVNQLLLVSADDLEQIDKIGPGNVACLVGLKNTVTGDTLVLDKGPIHSYVLDGLQIPKPVFSIAIEPEKSSQQKELEGILKILLLEDPSLCVDIGKESGQTLLRGLGELHLEIVCDRIRREFNIDVTTGKTYIAYRETMNVENGIIEKRFVYDRTMGTKRMFSAITIQATPTGDNSEPTIILDELMKHKLQKDENIALIEGIKESFTRGLKGFPVVGIDLKVIDVERDTDTTIGSVRACSSIIISNLLRDSNHVILEPIMLAEIDVPIKYVGDVLQDLTVKRRGLIKEVTVSPHYHQISVHVPLSSMLGYATGIRSMTQGEGSFSMEYVEHKEVDLALLEL